LCVLPPCTANCVQEYGEEFPQDKRVENPKIYHRQEIILKNEILKVFQSLSTILSFDENMILKNLEVDHLTFRGKLQN
jgi:hypothetical protein